jgi:hypothetical protein
MKCVEHLEFRETHVHSIEVRDQITYQQERQEPPIGAVIRAARIRLPDGFFAI